MNKTLPALAGSLALAATFGVQASPSAEGLLSGLDFVLKPVMAVSQRDACVSIGQAARGAGAVMAPVAFGGLVGGILGAVTTGKVINGAAIGAAMGEMGSTVLEKRLQGAASVPLGYQAELKRTLCETFERASRDREPVVNELTQDVGAICGLHPEDAQGAGDEFVQKLRTCAVADSQVMAKARRFLDIILTINRSACLSAAAQVRTLNDKYSKLAAGRDQSFIWGPEMSSCNGWRTSASEWAPIWTP